MRTTAPTQVSETVAKSAGFEPAVKRVCDESPGRNPALVASDTTTDDQPIP